ncbi:MAG: LLM class flavin-dependent oxidoreductase [Kordiimonadaceae bacterium]|nr:LLM class flavin-dependent oxidoreductase [Kordiimonadaceae bacterium]
MDNDLLRKVRAADLNGPISQARTSIVKNEFLLGLALPAQQGAWTFSDVPTSTTWHWKYLRDIAMVADKGGFNFLFIGSQYFPPGGYNGLHRTHSLEAINLAASLAAVTDNIYLFPTISGIGEVTPVYFSRVISSLDNISNGRIGVNLMSNLAVGDVGHTWGKITEIAERYKVADEFMVIAKRLWQEDEPLRYEGKYFQVYDGYISPKPIQKPFPLLMSADLTEESAPFLESHCQIRFIAPTSNVGSSDPRKSALMDVRASGLQYIVCRETQAEAQKAYDEICSKFNPHTLAGHSKKFDQTGDGGTQLAPSLAAGGNIALDPIIGTPQHVADMLVKLKNKGIGGVQITFSDYANELPFFVEQAMPLIRETGILSA